MSQEKTSRDILGCRNPWDLKCVELGVLRSVIDCSGLSLVANEDAQPCEGTNHCTTWYIQTTS